MTALEVCFRYAAPPTEDQLIAVANLREVYGIRRLTFDAEACRVRVEYDATRLNEDTVAGLLRRAGLDLREKVLLATAGM